MNARYGLLVSLSLVVCSSLAAEPLRQRTPDALAQRLNRAASAERRADAIASGRVAHDTVGDVVLGDRNPELLMRWELMTFIAGVFSDDSQRETYLSSWRGRLPDAAVPHSVVAQLPVLIAPFLQTEGQMRLAQIQLNRGAGEQEAAIRERLSALNSSLCRLRAEALAASRATFGPETFDRFLYQVVAPDVVIISSPPISAEDDASMWLWVEGGCQ